LEVAAGKRTPRLDHLIDQTRQTRGNGDLDTLEEACRTLVDLARRIPVARLFPAAPANLEHALGLCEADHAPCLVHGEICPT